MTKRNEIYPPPSEAANAVTKLRLVTPAEGAELAKSLAQGADAWRRTLAEQEACYEAKSVVPDRLRDSALAQIGLGIFVGLVVLGILATVLP